MQQILVEFSPITDAQSLRRLLWGGLMVVLVNALWLPAANAGMADEPLVDVPAQAGNLSSATTSSGREPGTTERPFFLDPQFDNAIRAVYDGPQGSNSEPASAGFSLSLWSAAPVIAVLLLAAVNARKRRNKLAATVAGTAAALLRR